MHDKNSLNPIIVKYQENSQPDTKELYAFFENVFLTITDSNNFSPEQDQKLSEWFSIDEMISYLPYGELIEARLENGQLVGAIFIGKQHPISWSDGNKTEIFNLGVREDHRGHDIARKLMKLAEDYARSIGSKKILVNTHEAMTTVQVFYKKMGYTEMGVLRDYYDNGNAIYFQKTVD